MRHQFSNIINRISIGSKILLGFVLVLVVFLGISLSFLNIIEKDLMTILKLTSLTEVSTSILDINREVSEIQRLTVVYGQTGSKSVLEKINTLYLDLKFSLKKTSKKYTDEEANTLLLEMIEVIDRYGESILP